MLSQFNLTISFQTLQRSNEKFAIFPRFLEDLLQRKDLVRGAATRT